MLVAAVVLMVLGIGLVSLSQWRRNHIMGVGLPSREEGRRVWLPSGLVLMTLSILFGITYSTTLPSSPLRLAETDSAVTRNAHRTMQAHTQYFQMHTVTHIYGIQPTLRVGVSPTWAPGISQFEITATALIVNASATIEANLTQFAIVTKTQLAVNQRTLDAGDYIAATGTANAIATSTATPH